MRISQQQQQAVPNQIGGGLLPANHRDDAVGDDLRLAQPVAVDLGGHERMHDAFSRLALLLAHLGTEIGCHFFDGLQH